GPERVIPGLETILSLFRYSATRKRYKQRNAVFPSVIRVAQRIEHSHVAAEKEPEVLAGHRIARGRRDRMTLRAHLNDLHVACSVDGFPEGYEPAGVGMEESANACSPQLRKHGAGSRPSVEFRFALRKSVFSFGRQSSLRRGRSSGNCLPCP